jgi:hypothetical protein
MLKSINSALFVRSILHNMNPKIFPADFMKSINPIYNIKDLQLIFNKMSDNININDPLDNFSFYTDPFKYKNRIRYYPSQELFLEWIELNTPIDEKCYNLLNTIRCRSLTDTEKNQFRKDFVTCVYYQELCHFERIMSPYVLNTFRSLNTNHIDKLYQFNQ